MKNSWDHKIPHVSEIIAHPDFRVLLCKVVFEILSVIDQSPDDIQTIIDILLDSKFQDIQKLEKLLHSKIVAQERDKTKINRGMLERAKIIASQIEKYLQGESLIDIGCGHGLVSWQVRRHFSDILLVDIVDYRDPEVLLPFVIYDENEFLPLDYSYDCSLLIAVLHHARDPLKLLKDVWQHTSGRLIIIESVFDVGSSSANSPLPQLDQLMQLYYAVFCDWFYNRVLNQGVSVPYNFNTPKNWRKIFETLPAKISTEVDLGVDLEIVPEHHFLFVLDRF